MRGLLELTPAALLSAVGVRALAERVGIGAPAVYHHFGSLEGYAEAVVAHAFDPGNFGVGDVSALVEDLLVDSMPVEASRAFHRAEFARASSDPLVRARLGLWALGGAPMDRAYGEMLRAVDDGVGTFAAPLFDGWGRELVPPYDVPAYVAVQSSLLIGYVIRHAADPSRLGAERFARTAQALTTAMLRLKGDERTLDDQLVQINYYPLHARGLSAPTGSPRADHRDRVLRAAADLLQRDGIVGTSVARIAAHAGVSASTVYRMFDGVADIAERVLLAEADGLLSGREWGDGTGPERVAERALAVGAVLAPRLGYAGSYCARLMTGQAVPHDPLLAAVRDGYATTRGAGPIDGQLPVDDLARSTLLLLTGRLFSHRSEGSAASVAHVMKLIADCPWATSAAVGD